MRLLKFEIVDNRSDPPQAIRTYKLEKAAKRFLRLHPEYSLRVVVDKEQLGKAKHE